MTQDIDKNRSKWLCCLFWWNYLIFFSFFSFQIKSTTCENLICPGGGLQFFLFQFLFLFVLILKSTILFRFSANVGADRKRKRFVRFFCKRGKAILAEEKRETAKRFSEELGITQCCSKEWTEASKKCVKIWPCPVEIQSFCIR